MNEFCSSVVPRIRDETVFGSVGKNAKLEIERYTREEMIVLYHSIQIWNRNGVIQTIQRLLQEKILKQKATSGNWDERSVYDLFFKSITFRGFEYFCTSRRHFKHVMSEFSHF